MSNTQFSPLRTVFWENSLASKYVLLLSLAFFLAGWTGFSVTMSTLREFGMRPVNLLLLIILLIGTIQALRGTKLLIPTYAFIAGCAFLIILPLNIVVLISRLELLYGVHLPVTAWLFQFMMFVWLPCSFLAWFILFRPVALSSMGPKVIIIALAISSVLHIALFVDKAFYYTSLLGISPFGGFVTGEGWRFLVTSTDIRPSGLNTEPSHLATWAIWVWPFLLLLDRKEFSSYEIWGLRLVGLLVVFCAIASGARTAIMLIAVQCVALSGVVLLFQIGKVRDRTIMTTVGALLCATGLIFGWEKVVSVFDTENLSSAMRWGNFVGAWRMMNDWPLWGVGLGGYAARFAFYFPVFGQVSSEFYDFTQSNYLPFRPNASSFYLRVGAELGVFALISLCTLIAGPILHLYGSLRTANEDLRGLYLPLSVASAGVLVTWVATDETAYPGIGIVVGLTLALIAAREAKTKQLK